MVKYKKVWKIRNQSPIFNKDSEDLYRANEIFKENLYEPGPELVNEQITKYRISSSSEENIQVFITQVKTYAETIWDFQGFKI